MDQAFVPYCKGKADQINLALKKLDPELEPEM